MLFERLWYRFGRSDNCRSGLNGRSHTGFADQRRAFSSYIARQKKNQPFTPDLNTRRGKFWLNHQSVCFLPGSLPPPVLRSRACWLMAPARSLSPVTTTPPEPICTTASKRFAGAISMSLLVPLLEFNRCWKTRARARNPR